MPLTLDSVALTQVHSYHRYGLLLKVPKSLTPLRDVAWTVPGYRDELKILKAKGEDPNQELKVTEGTTSMVGPPVMVKYDFISDQVPVFFLREPRARHVQDHKFGVENLRQTYSWLDFKDYDVPPVGTSIIINPQLTGAQRNFTSNFDTISADAVYMFYIGDCLGVSLQLEISTPDLDNTTQNRGVLMIPPGSNSAVFHVPHNSEYTHLAQALKGQSGCSLRIKTIFNNTTETVTVPLKMTIGSCYTNLVCTGVQSGWATRTNEPRLEFTPQAPLADEPYEDLVEAMQNFKLSAIREQSENEPVPEITAGDSSETQESLVADSPVDTTPETKVDKPTPLQKDPKLKTVSKDPNKHSAAQYHLFARQTMSTSSQYTVAWNSALNENGTFLNEPYKKFVWFSGKRVLQQGTMDGYVTMNDVMLTILSPPQQKAMILASFGVKGCGPQLICEVGEKAMLSPIPDVFSQAPSRNRDSNTPWIRYDNVSTEFYLQKFGHNKTSEVVDLEVTVHMKTENVLVQVPKRKIKKAATPSSISLMLQEGLDTTIANTYDTLKRIAIREQSHVAPHSASGKEMGQVVPIGDCEEIAHDEFKTNLGPFKLTPGTPLAVTIELHKLQDSVTLDQSPIQDKMARFANITPKEAGEFGPKIGQYQIIGNLGANDRCNIRHVSIPADMNVEAVTYIFGLSSLASIATSALAHLGGPLASAIVDVGRNALGSLGSVVGSVAQPLLNALTGNLEIPRDLRFLKQTVEGEAQLSTSPIVLMEAENPSPGTSTVDVRMLVEMMNMFVDRMSSNRSVLPPTTPTVANLVYFNAEDAITINRAFIEYFSRPGITSLKSELNSRQMECCLKFKQFFSTKTYRANALYNTKEILDTNLESYFKTTQAGEVSLIEKLLKRPLYKNYTT